MRDRETEAVEKGEMRGLAQELKMPGASQCPTVAFSEEGLLNHLFSYHSPYGTQTMQYQAIREAAKYFAKIVLSNTPKSADQSDAIRKIREAVMTANASIALGGVSS